MRACEGLLTGKSCVVMVGMTNSPLELTIMHHARLALVFVVSVGVPATAGSAELSGYAADVMLLADDQNHQTQSVPHPLVKQISAGNVELVLEETTLLDLQRNFGGSLRMRDDAGNSISWLCFTHVESQKPFTVWFLSNELGGSDKMLTGIILKSNEDARKHCDVAPTSLVSVRWDAPAIGDSQGSMLEKFGLAQSALGTDVMVDNSSPLDPNGLIKLQTLFYRLRDGAVDGVALFQITTK